jgi:hypothetical protein
MMRGRAAAQAVRRRLLTAKTWVQPWLRFILGTVALKQIYFRVISVFFVIHHSTIAVCSICATLRAMLLVNMVTALIIIFFNLHSGGWNQGPLDTAAT